MDDWFTRERIDEDTDVLSEYRHWEETHCYLLNGSERSLLIDTGFRQEEGRRALFAGLAELDVDPRDVDVALTHLHSDHSGLAPEVVGETGWIYVLSLIHI